MSELRVLTERLRADRLALEAAERAHPVRRWLWRQRYVLLWAIALALAIYVGRDILPR